MSGANSYWLPNGEIIFAYDTQAAHYPPWIIARRGKRASRKFSDADAPVKAIVRHEDGSLKRYKTEAEARAALRQYAKEHDLKAAY